MSKNEKTANDSYLIVKGEEKEMKKISYRGNLIEEFKDDDAVYSKIQHIKPLNLSAILCIKSLKYFNLCDKIAFIGIAHGDTGMRAAEASRRLVLFLLLRGVLK